MDALFVIDMNKGFCEEGNLAAPHIKEIVPNINKFYKENKDNLSTVIAFTDCHDENSREFEYMPTHCVSEKEQELVDEFDVEFNEIIKKNSTNGFHQFLSIDDAVFRGFYGNEQFWTTKNFYITGCLTSYCVMQFALSLQTWLNEFGNCNDYNKGKVVVLKDCCADVDKEMEEWAIKYMKLNGIEVR